MRGAPPRNPILWPMPTARPAFGYVPRPSEDPHVGLRYAFNTAQKGRLDALGVIDLLPNCPPNRFQDRAGSCTGQGFGHAVHYLLKSAAKDGLMPEEYSPSSLAIYAWERMAAGTFLEDRGSTLARGVEVLTNEGVPRESDWPYDESKLFVVPDEATARNARRRKLINARPLVHDVDEIRHALSTDCPVIIGAPCYDSIFDPETFATGYVPEPASGDSIAGWHCIVIYKHDPYANRFYFKNWWRGWGVDCVGSFSEDYVIRRTNELYALGAIR